MRHVVRQWSKALIGVTFCSAAAIMVSLLAAEQPWRFIIPVGFVAVTVLLAVRFGLAAGILGSAMAAMIFAYAFPPVGSLRVASEAERANLAWMLLGSVAISFLLVPPSAHHRK
jgi:K+-sensing histidine kinase KdpD